MQWRRTTRLAAGAFVLFAAGTILWPHFLNRVSESAVINAPLLSIKAPFDGVVVSGPLRPGDAILPGAQIVELEASRRTGSEIARLEANRGALDGNRSAIMSEIDALQSLDADLARRVADAREMAREVLRLERDALQSDLEAARMEALRFQMEAARLSQLRKSAAVAGTRVDEAQSVARVAVQRVQSLESQLARAELRIRSVDGSVLPTFGTEDGSYAQQRRDEIAIRLADLRARRDSLTAQIAANDVEIGALRAEAQRLKRFAPSAESGAVVWTASPATGSTVATGDEILQILDCSRRFMEVTVSEGAQRHVVVDGVAWVRLRGTSEPFTARVERIRGAGSTPATGLLAARPVSVSDEALTVILRLGPADVSSGDVAARFCSVGRTAEVRFRRDLPGPLNGLADEVLVLLRAAGAEARAAAGRMIDAIATWNALAER